MILTVSEVTLLIKNLLEQNPTLRQVSVSGEVSNLTYHSSGHVYFSIKDNGAQISCTLFKQVASFAPKLKDGDKVVATGQVSVYPPHGKYSLNVSSIQKSGLGALYQQFLELKEKLQKEGLFDVVHKKPIPRIPQKIVIITSPTGAAIHDMLNTLQKKYPPVKVILIPAAVQGVTGADAIVAALQKSEALTPDVILLGRGGGSIEDLWNFNEEKVARAMFACSIPIITGIGHESDTTIADYVADHRAATPTAAAEKAVPDKAMILNYLKEQDAQIRQALLFYVDVKKQIIEGYTNRITQAMQNALKDRKHLLKQQEHQLVAILPTHIQQKKHEVERLFFPLQQAWQEACMVRKNELLGMRNQLPLLMQQSLQNQKHALGLLENSLMSLHQSHTQILDKGYTLTLKNGQKIHSAEEIASGDLIETVWKDGRKTSKVE